MIRKGWSTTMCQLPESDLTSIHFSSIWGETSGEKYNVDIVVFYSMLYYIMFYYMISSTRTGADDVEGLAEVSLLASSSNFNNL